MGWGETTAGSIIHHKSVYNRQKITQQHKSSVYRDVESHLFKGDVTEFSNSAFSPISEQELSKEEKLLAETTFKNYLEDCCMGEKNDASISRGRSEMAPRVSKASSTSAFAIN